MGKERCREGRRCFCCSRATSKHKQLPRTYKRRTLPIVQRGGLAKPRLGHQCCLSNRPRHTTDNRPHAFPNTSRRRVVNLQKHLRGLGRTTCIWAGVSRDWLPQGCRDLHPRTRQRGDLLGPTTHYCPPPRGTDQVPSECCESAVGRRELGGAAAVSHSQANPTYFRAPSKGLRPGWRGGQKASALSTPAGVGALLGAAPLLGQPISAGGFPPGSAHSLLPPRENTWLVATHLKEAGGGGAPA